MNIAAQRSFVPMFLRVAAAATRVPLRPRKMFGRPVTCPAATTEGAPQTSETPWKVSCVLA